MATGPSSSFANVPPPPGDQLQETLFLSRDGRELEIELQYVTPSSVARAFEVSRESIIDF